ncbi:MAG: YceI family protein [Cryomorphaceae bacterium]|jgi:polyisoprenoid-binding protein YceI|nr:YceI family protein [Cryomorphaceae bacterium]
MKTKKYILFLLGFVGLTAFTILAINNYEVTKDFSIEFKSKDPSGSFKIMEGQIDFDEKDLANSNFDFKIDVRSISTGNGMMTKKAQTPEWFDSAKHPYAKFKSTKVEKKEGNLYNITGNLTIKGITKTVTVPANYSNTSGKKITFKGTFNVNRIDFKVGKKSTAVPDIMKVNFEIPAQGK